MHKAPQVRNGSYKAEGSENTERRSPKVSHFLLGHDFVLANETVSATRVVTEEGSSATKNR